MRDFRHQAVYEARPIGFRQYALLCDEVCVGVIRDNRMCNSACLSPAPLAKQMDMITFAQRQFRTSKGWSWEGLTDLLHQRQVRLHYNGNVGGPIDDETMRTLS